MTDHRGEQAADALFANPRAEYTCNLIDFGPGCNIELEAGENLGIDQRPTRWARLRGNLSRHEAV